MLKLLGKLEIVKYLIAAILLAVPLYPKFPFINIPGTYVSIRLEDFLMLSAAIVAGIYWLPRLKELYSFPLTRRIFIFLAIGLVSVLSGVFLIKSIPINIGMLHWVRRIEYFIPLLLGLAVIKDKAQDNIEFFVKILMIVVFIAFVYGVGQKYFGWPVIVTQNLEYSKGIALRWIPGSHINSTFAGHYDLATFLVLVLPIFISTLVLVRKIKARIVLLIVIAGGYWLLSNAISRISIVSFLGSTGIALVLLKKWKEVLIFSVISLVFFSFSGDLISRYKRLIDVGRIKIQKLIILPKIEVYARDTPSPTPQPVFEDRSSSIRFDVEWPRALRAFTKNPILGTGYSSITLATDNDYLRLLGEVGLMGFTSFTLILVTIGLMFFKALPLLSTLSSTTKAFLAGSIGSLSGVLLNAVFIDVFEASKFAIIFWLLVGISVALVRSNNYDKNL